MKNKYFCNWCRNTNQYEVFELKTKEQPLTRIELEVHKKFLYESWLHATYKKAVSDSVTTIYTVPDEAKFSGVTEVSIWRENKKIYEAPFLDRFNLQEDKFGYYIKEGDVYFHPKPPRKDYEVRIYFLKEFDEAGNPIKYEGKKIPDIIVGFDNLVRKYPKDWKTIYRNSYGTHCHICQKKFEKEHFKLVEEIEELKAKKDYTTALFKEEELKELWRA